MGKSINTYLKDKKYIKQALKCLQKYDKQQSEGPVSILYKLLWAKYLAKRNLNEALDHLNEHLSEVI